MTNTDAIQRGRDDYRAGHNYNHCPLSGWWQNVAWRQGWLDAQRAAKAAECRQPWDITRLTA